MGGSGLQHARRLSMFCYYFQAAPGLLWYQTFWREVGSSSSGILAGVIICCMFRLYDQLEKWQWLRDGRLESAGGKNQNKIGGWLVGLMRSSCELGGCEGEWNDRREWAQLRTYTICTCGCVLTLLLSYFSVLVASATGKSSNTYNL